jgi:hypothetical protein
MKTSYIQHWRDAGMARPTKATIPAGGNLPPEIVNSSFTLIGQG